MTIVEGLIKWLQDYQSEYLDIQVDQLDAIEEAYGAFKLPESNITKYIDGSEDVQEYYIFAIRKPTAQDFQRISNNDWLEKLDEWIKTKTDNKEFPIVDGVVFYDVEITSSFYLSETSEEDGVYQLTLMVNYERS